MADLTERLNRLAAERANAPFGDTDSTSGKTLQRFSRASHAKAANLLVKAVRAVEAGDRDRARGYVERAAKLPYDRHEQQYPLAGEAHMLLFNLVTDELEECEQGDESWLEAAVVVLEAADEALRCDLRDVLQVIDNEYDISKHEQSALRAAIADVPPSVPLRDLVAEPGELVDIAFSLVDGAVAYLDAVDALSAEDQ